jgi:hypothetical protein
MTASVRYTVGNRFERLVVSLPKRLVFGPSLTAISGPYVRRGTTGIISIDESRCKLEEAAGDFDSVFGRPTGNQKGQGAKGYSKV